MCAVFVADRQVGTGFLVGEDLVLTASQIVAPWLDGSVGRAALEVRFDLRTGRRGIVSPGSRFGGDAPVAYRPHGTGPGALGYALLRLDGAPGALPIGGERVESAGAVRGWISLRDHGYVEPRDPLFVVFCPRGEPVTLATGATGWAADPTRIQHTASVTAGAAGAPCFTPLLEIVGMHLGSGGELHEAVSIEAVVADLNERGHGFSVDPVFS